MIEQPPTCVATRCVPGFRTGVFATASKLHVSSPRGAPFTVSTWRMASFGIVAGFVKCGPLRKTFTVFVSGFGRLGGGGGKTTAAAVSTGGGSPTDVFARTTHTPSFL